VRRTRTVVLAAVVGVLVVATAFVGGALTGKHLATGTETSPEAPEQRVIVYGDSLVVQAEPYLSAVAHAFRLHVDVRAFGGLAPCDALAGLADDLRHSRPHLVVFAFSGNSLSNCMRDANGELARGLDILTKYRSDIETAIKMTTQAGVPFVLASPPASEDHSDAWKALDSVYRDIAAEHDPLVQYTDAGEQIAPAGEFTETQRCLPFELDLPQSRTACQDDGGMIGVRALDGVHFCSNPPTATTTAPACTEYSSGAFRYGIALVSAARLDLDYFAALSSLPSAAFPP